MNASLMATQSGLKNVQFVQGDYLSEGLFALGVNKSK